MLFLKITRKNLDLSPKQRQRWHKKCLCLVEFENVNYN
jgi:hypothetical protein